MSDKQINNLFNHCCEKVKDLKSLSNDIKLKVYALFKVSTEGSYDIIKDKEIGFFDFEKKAKYSAWKSFSNLSKEEAKIEYIKLYHKLAEIELPIDIENKELIENKDFDENIANTLSNLENIESHQVSSSAKEDQKEIKSYLENASNEECVYFDINNDFFKGKLINEEYFNKYKHINLLELRDRSKSTILHSAADTKNYSAVATLVSLNIAQKLIDIQDEYGMTPLHIACINYNLECLELLFSINPNIQIKDASDLTALEYLEDNELLQQEEISFIKNKYFKS